MQGEKIKGKRGEEEVGYIGRRRWREEVCIGREGRIKRQDKVEKRWKCIFGPNFQSHPKRI